MLPTPNLDDERFLELTEKARILIAKYAPNWTDYNAHDPGITFLELFAWMKELQQYELNQVSREARLKFLKLLQIDRHTKRPARTLLHCSSVKKDCRLPAGTCALAGEIPFETTQPLFLSDAVLTDCAFVREDMRVRLGEPLGSGRSGLRFYPFGREPCVGDALQLTLSEAVPQGEKLTLALEVFEDYPVKRNPISHDFVSLAKIQWLYWGQDAWQPITSVEDGTYGFLQSGMLSLSIDGEMSIDAEGGYQLRACLTDCSYDVAPILTALFLNAVPAEQRRTLCRYVDVAPAETVTLELENQAGLRRQLYLRRDGVWSECVTYQETQHGERMTLEIPDAITAECIRIVTLRAEFLPEQTVGEGYGFPNQSYHLETPDLMETGFALMAMDGGTAFCDWTRVSDFDASTPDDRHYVFEEESATIRFGDCEHGTAPEGLIRIISCAATLGKAGNVKAFAVDRFENPEIAADVSNQRNVEGGCNAESIEESFLRLRRTQNSPNRAVTYEDYEFLTSRTPGLMVESCQAIPAYRTQAQDGSVDESCVTMVVRPYSDSGLQPLSMVYQENIRRHLEDRQLICTRLQVVSPEYVGVTVYAQLVCKPYYRNAREEIEAALAAFFAKRASAFGEPVRHSELYGSLDTLDCVTSVQSLGLDAQGRGITRNAAGDILLPYHGMIYLKRAELTLTATE